MGGHFYLTQPDFENLLITIGFQIFLDLNSLTKQHWAHSGIKRLFRPEKQLCFDSKYFRGRFLLCSLF